MPLTLGFAMALAYSFSYALIRGFAMDLALAFWLCCGLALVGGVVF